MAPLENFGVQADFMYGDLSCKVKQLGGRIDIKTAMRDMRLPW